MTGKEKCNLLKQIRREIAETNGIVYLTSECTYTGSDCTGTCPKCDAELRYLDAELNAKVQSGTPITLSGLTLDGFSTDCPKKELPDFDMPIKSMDFTYGCYCCLNAAGIDTLGLIESSSKEELRCLPGMKPKYLEEIMWTLEWYGLSISNQDDGVFAEMGAIPCIENDDN